MTQVKHTPGPWAAISMNNRASKYWWSISGMDGLGDVVCNTPNNNASDEANAKLIAAAPELLEALQQLRIDLNSNMIETARKRIEEAIKKATA